MTHSIKYRLVLLVAVWLLGTSGQASEYRIPNTEVNTLDDGGRQYDIAIKLPDNYYQPGQFSQRYPVIYMLDASYSLRWWWVPRIFQ
ncbi:hypothetical protein [Bowmanella pacifica]|uniref:hypothetical protein n=1 Tax=Bowmanella pacifica TaxID=502051 RepID=UPI0016650A6D|nr:hypothetical protein [Bowmanella pacifica]